MSVEYTENEIGKAIEFFEREVWGAKNFWQRALQTFFAPKRPNVIGLKGNLGAGKTTFTKNFLQKYGHVGAVPSPTFVLRRDYDTSFQNFKKIIHIDAYRLDKPEDIFQVISKKELADENNLVIIEWPEKTLPEIFDKIFLFEHTSDLKRSISLLI